jgi:FkbM family methyltransferase
MTLAYKMGRVQRFARVVGAMEALRFELAWSMRRDLVDIRLPDYGEPMRMRRHSSDLNVFETVFVNREFEQVELSQPRLIIDGGANIGFSAAFFAKRYPQAQVIAVEPSRANAALLRCNCRAFPNVRVVEGGLWPTSGRLRIANPEDPPWSYFCEPAVGDAADAFDAVAVEDLIELSGCLRCDLLKLDIEGGERALFADAGRWLGRVDAILVEIHGPQALDAVREACPSSRWDWAGHGEKLLLRSRRAGLFRS